MGVLVNVVRHRVRSGLMKGVASNAISATEIVGQTRSMSVMAKDVASSIE